MGFEAGLLLVALREGGTYRITFWIEILARKFKNVKKSNKKFSPLPGEYVLLRRRPVLSIACPVRPRGGEGVEGS